MANKGQVNFKMSMDARQMLTTLKSVANGLQALSTAANSGALTKKGMIAGIQASLQQVNAGIASAQNSMQNAQKSAQSFSSQLKTSLKTTGVESFKNSFMSMKNSVVNGTRTMVNSWSSLRNVMSQTIDAARQVTQGFLSMGRALTFFIAIPFTAFLKESISVAKDYEEQLFRVAKVAGFKAMDFNPNTGKREYTQQYKDFDNFIRDMSAVSGSDQSQFGKWAEELAQFGVESLSAIQRYMPIMEMFSQSTDVSAETVVSSLGNIANAFGYSMAKGGKEVEDFVWRMANTINKLENITGANAGQIITALEDAGPTLSILKVKPDVIASWAALGIEAGLSANEVGTGLRNLGSFMTRNYDKMMVQGGLLEKAYGNLDNLRTAMTKDFGGVFNDLINMYSTEEDKVKVIAELYQFLGMRAGRLGTALTAQANAQEAYASRMQNVMQMSANEWVTATSLAGEYASMQDSLAFKSKQLKNNLNNLALTVGDTLIPVFKDLVVSITPAVKAMANLFAGLSDNTKRTLVIVSAMVAVGGPLIFFFSQMAFGASLIASGLMKAGASLGMVVKVMGVFGLQLVRLNPIAWMFAGLISKAFSMASQSVGRSVSAIGKVVGGLADAMPDWGENMFSGLATGIQAAERTIIQSITNIAKIIASFFESHSPPETGPLQHIDKWGKTLFDTYLEGFLKADFGILKDVAGYVEHILSSWIDIGKLGEDGNAEAMLLRFRTGFAKLLSDFNATGEIAEEALNNLVNVFGEASDEIAKLIRLNLQLKNIELQIEAIEKRKQGVTKYYRDQVRALITSNMSLEEQARIIGQLQTERDQDLAILDEEQEALEERKSAAEEELDLQKQLLEAYKDQDDIFAKMLQTIESYLESLKNLAGGGVGISGSVDLSGFGDLGELDSVSSAMASFGASITKLQTKALAMQIIVQGVVQSIKKLIDPNIKTSLDDMIESAIGKDQFTKTAESAFKYLTEMDTASKDFGETIQGLESIFGKELLLKVLDPKQLDTLDKADIRVQALTEALAGVGMENIDRPAIVKALEAIETSSLDAFEVAETNFDDISNIYTKLNDILEPLYKKTQAFMLALSGGDTSGVDYKIEGMQEIVDTGRELGEVFSVLEEKMPIIFELLGKAGENLLKSLGFDFESGDISGQLSAVLDGIISTLETFSANPLEWMIGISVGVSLAKASLAGLAGVAGGFISNIAGQVGGWLLKQLPLIANGVQGFLGTAAGVATVSFVGWSLVAFLPIAISMVATKLGYGMTEDDLNSDQAKWGDKFAGMAPPLANYVSSYDDETFTRSLQQAGVKIEKAIKRWEGDLSGILHDRVAPLDEVIGSGLYGFFDRQEEALRGRLDGLVNILDSGIMSMEPTDIQGYADLLGVGANDLLTGKVKVPDITINAPNLTFTGLDEKVTVLADTLKKNIETALATGNFALNSTFQENLANGVMSALTAGLSGVQADTTILGAMILNIVNGIVTANANNAGVTTKLTELAQQWAAQINNIFTANLFTTESAATVANVATLIANISASSTTLGTGFKEAHTAFGGILTLIKDSFWAGFVAQVQKLGDGGSESFSYVFEQAEQSASNLYDYLTGPFSDGLQGVIDLFNQLMQGNWNMSVSITHFSTPFGSGTTGWGGRTDEGKYGGSTQTGGAVTLPTLVGETGTELFTPPVAGHITSHSLLSNMMTQSDNVGKRNEYNVSVVGSPVQMTEEELKRMLRNLEVLYG